MNTPDEEALVARARQGDAEAFETLVSRCQERLTAWLRSRIGPKIRHKIDAEDLVQETQMRAFESLERFVWRGTDSFFRWLCAIAEHLVWNASQRRSSTELRLTVDPQRSTASPSQELRRQERFDRLEGAFAELLPQEREALRLSRFEGLTLAEVGARMQRTQPAVKSLITRALRKLRDSIGDTESLHLPDRRLKTPEPKSEG